MKINEAVELIAFKNKEEGPQLWLDLGCGTGLFTRALTHYLPSGSRIRAVDTDTQALGQLPGTWNAVTIEPVVADFVHDPPDVQVVDGILMANSLHYVRDKEGFLLPLSRSLKTGAVFLIVEYYRKTSNPGVPYPLAIEDAKVLFHSLGYWEFELLHQRPSVYGRHTIYAALISRGE